MFLLAASLFLVLASGTSSEDANDNSSAVGPRLLVDMDSGIAMFGRQIETDMSLQRPESKMYGPLVVPTPRIIISGINTLTFGNVHTFHPTGNLGNEESLLLKLWTSSAIRDNLVTVFGRLLFQGKWPDNYQTYSALMLIYSNLRLRKIRTIDMLPALQQASTASPSGQMLILLNALSRIVPRFLTSAVEEVILSASDNDKLIDNLMQPDEGPLLVDFLAGINSSHIMTAIKPIHFGNIIEEKEVSELLGRTLSQIYAAIFNGRLHLSQPLFAGIISHLPANDLNPRGEEFMRLLIEYLRGQKINNWPSIVGKLNDMEKKRPYVFVKRIIKSISTSISVSETIREAATTVVQYLQEPEVTLSNQYFKILSPIISKPTIDFTTLLESITYPEFPADVVDMKNRIIYFIQHGYLDIDLVTKGFMRYDHVKPIDLVIAILTRITTTMTNLPTEIVSSVKSLTVHLIFKEFSCSMASTIPSELLDLYLLISAFKSPSLPTYFITAVDEILIPIIKALPDEITAILSQMPLYLCTQPRTCLINVLMKVKITYPLKIRPFLHILVPFLEQAQIFLKFPPPIITNLTQLQTTFAPVNIPYPTSEKPVISFPITQRPDVNITINEISFDEIIQRPEIWSILISVSRPPQDIHFPLPNPIYEVLPVIPDAPLGSLLPAPLPGTPEFDLLKPIRLLLSVPEVSMYIYKYIKVEDYATRGELLRAVLNFLLEIRIIQQLPGLSEYIKTYLYQLDMLGNTNQLEIFWGGLLVALPLPETQIEIKKFEIIKTFLQGNISIFIGGNFNPKQFKVKGQLLKALFQFLLTLPQIRMNQELFASIQYYVDRVLLHGFGAQPVEYIYSKITTTTKTLDLMSIFSAFNKKLFDTRAKNAYDNMIKYFLKGTNIQGFNFRKYKTKGSFLKALLEFLINDTSTPDNIKRDFRILIPYIIMTGPGGEPVQYD